MSVRTRSEMRVVDCKKGGERFRLMGFRCVRKITSDGSWVVVDKLPLDGTHGISTSVHFVRYYP